MNYIQYHIIFGHKVNILDFSFVNKAHVMAG